MIVLAFVCAAGGIYAAWNGHPGDAAVLSSISILISLFVLAGRSPHSGQRTGHPGQTRHSRRGDPNLAGGGPAGRSGPCHVGEAWPRPAARGGPDRPHPRHWEQP